MLQLICEQWPSAYELCSWISSLLPQRTASKLSSCIRAYFGPHQTKKSFTLSLSKVLRKKITGLFYGSYVQICARWGNLKALWRRAYWSRKQHRKLRFYTMKMESFMETSISYKLANMNHSKFGIIWKHIFSATRMWENLFPLDAKNCGNLNKLANIKIPEVTLTWTPTVKENWRHFLWCRLLHLLEPPVPTVSLHKLLIITSRSLETIPCVLSATQKSG